MKWNFFKPLLKIVFFLIFIRAADIISSDPFISRWAGPIDNDTLYPFVHEHK